MSDFSFTLLMNLKNSKENVNISISDTRYSLLVQGNRSNYRALYILSFKTVAYYPLHSCQQPVLRLMILLVRCGRKLYWVFQSSKSTSHLLIFQSPFRGLLSLWDPVYIHSLAGTDYRYVNRKDSLSLQKKFCVFFVAWN